MCAAVEYDVAQIYKQPDHAAVQFQINLPTVELVIVAV